ncbi:SPOSA6832_00582 [Sporobolomyces salmonicolor]|uniref:SPOSA6832_00582-mRNA-1:cds n=1 Tax=Sporidiobolus salmonicolor TaxID=5005 RepID=A0A0D6EGH7_SPOSA|nr:SPOSA6832_00582 [Sporobolomyces salmonicolor]
MASNRDDVLQFLDSLDAYSGTPPKPSSASTVPRSASSSTLPAKGPPSSTVPPSSSTTAISAPGNAAEAQSVLDFLDEITQRSSTPTTSVKPGEAGARSSLPGGLSRSASRNNLAGGSPAVGAAAPPRRSTDSVRSQRIAAPSAQGGWGWSSVWSSASNVVQQASHVVQQARTVAEEQVKTATQSSGGIAGGLGGLGEGLMKALGENEQAKKWSEGVMGLAKGAHLDQLGKDLKSTTLKSLTDLLNAVAPPIAEHEVIQVSLSHDMVGYDGVETLVYRGLAKIMDQIEGGTLVVNKGTEEKPREQADPDVDVRDLNLVDGLMEGWKLAEASLDQLIKATYAPPAPPAVNPDGGITVPVTTCPVYLRIQPCLSPLPFLSSSSLSPSSDSTSPNAGKALFFLLVLRDPTHRLVHQSLSQSLPAAWLDIPFEENEWVEDQMVEVIRRSVEVVGQEYITHRMRAQADAISQARSEAMKALGEHNAQVGASMSEQEQVEEEASTAAQEARVGIV